MKFFRALVPGALVFATACGGAEAPPSSNRLSSVPARPQLMYVSVASDDTFHKVEVAGLDSPGAGGFITDLSCARVYFSANRGVCLASTTTADAKTTWAATVFDEHFAVVGSVPLTGEPSRVRVSPDGRLGAATVFESGHSYAEFGFSTRTYLLDLQAGRAADDIEQYRIFKDGKIIRKEDFKFWGVTFANDSDTFYATLDTEGVTYLVKASAKQRVAEVLREDVECPSLSPDNTRIAFKRRIGARSRGWWQASVLDLASMKETALTSETRSVDDQIEWLDDDRVLYHLVSGTTAADIWSLRADNSSAPERLVVSAFSPAVVR